MNDARHTFLTPVVTEPVQTDVATSDVAGLSPMAWRRLLKVGDAVAVYCGSIRYPDATVTSAPETFISIGQRRGKMNFNRRTGKLSTRRPLAHLFRIERP